ncbi:hypothetical protein SCAR479_05933 [Seiridium cardinale]|uniref:Uncharacterized protein n=1 Tax=Seiridium cardinale TaxID=138064 RepID=A0ABR2XUQ5_9PEZI
MVNALSYCFPALGVWPGPRPISNLHSPPWIQISATLTTAPLGDRRYTIASAQAPYSAYVGPREAVGSSGTWQATTACYLAFLLLLSWCHIREDPWAQHGKIMEALGQTASARATQGCQQVQFVPAIPKNEPLFLGKS